MAKTFPILFNCHSLLSKYNILLSVKCDGNDYHTRVLDDIQNATKITDFQIPP